MENTHEIVAKSGKKAVLRNSITYAQDRAITNIYLDSTLNRGQQRDAADKVGIEAVVVSIDGSTENIHQRYLELDLPTAREFGKAIALVLDPKVETPETASTGEKH